MIIKNPLIVAPTHFVVRETNATRLLANDYAALEVRWLIQRGRRV